MMQLERECRSFTRYLIGQSPTTYVIEKYLDFHKSATAVSSGDRFDRLLVSISARGPIWARLSDSYASVWRKNATVRKKLVLTLALLECAQPGFQELASPAAGWRRTLLRLTLNATVYAGSLAVSAAIFAPVNAWMVLRER